MNISSTIQLHCYGTSEGVIKAWESRERGGGEESHDWFVHHRVNYGYTDDDGKDVGKSHIMPVRVSVRNGEAVGEDGCKTSVYRPYLR